MTNTENREFTGDYSTYIEFINYAVTNKLGICSGESVRHIGYNKYEFELKHRGGCDSFRRCLIYKEGGVIRHKIKSTGNWMCED